MGLSRTNFSEGIVKGFHLGRFLFTVITVLAIVALASRVPAIRKVVFATPA